MERSAARGAGRRSSTSAAAGHTAEAVDLPGSPGNPTPVADVTLDAYAEQICEVLGGRPPAILVGQSMGGMAITQAAARCPEHVAALVYVAAFAPADGQSLIDLVALPEGAGDQVQANLVVEGRSSGRVAVMPAARRARGAVQLRRTASRPLRPRRASRRSRSPCSASRCACRTPRQRRLPPCRART